MSNGSKQIFPKRRHKMDDKDIKKFQFTNHQNNANQNRNEILPHPNNNDCCQKDYKYCWGYREKGTLAYWRWEWKLIQPPCKTVWKFLKNESMTTILCKWKLS
jgi:hypothetical protein